jgi:hypothetical protein
MLISDKLFDSLSQTLKDEIILMKNLNNFEKIKMFSFKSKFSKLFLYNLTM